MVSNIILTAYTWATTRIAMFKEERGQDIMEYAVLAGAIALIAGFVLFGGVADIDIPQAMADFGSAVENCIELSGECGI